MKRNEINLTFSIYDFDDLTHNDLSNIIGIEPSSVRYKGDKKNPNNIKSPLIEINKWSIDSGLSKYSDFDAHLDALLNILEPKIDIIKGIATQYQCEISCGIFIYFNNGESTPWVHLSERYNKIANQIKLDFDLDLYVLNK